MHFTIALIGRSNVGKSTLFNKLVGKRLAIVDDTIGVTRDRRIHTAQLQDLFFNLIDTAGLEEEKNLLQERVLKQTLIAMHESDLILFVFNAKEGVTISDRILADIVRKSRKTVIPVANKSESPQTATGFYEAWQLGLGEACAISAEHGLGFSDLRDAIFESCYSIGLSKKDKKHSNILRIKMGGIVHQSDNRAEHFFDDAKKTLQVAIIGRPNTGKSTLINALLGEERFLTGPEAGLTRDSVFVDLTWHKLKIRLYDTAGLRRKIRIQEKLEKLSVAETLRAIRFAEVVIIVLDATIPFKKQDLQITDFVTREGRAPIIAFNKWDLIENKQQILDSLQEKCECLLPQIRGIPTVPVSGERKEGLNELLENIKHVHHIWNLRISTGKLNRWLGDILIYHPPPAISGRRLKIKYITQAKTRPPGFVISCSRPDSMPQSYLRYLVNRLRYSFGLTGVPVRLFITTTQNPFVQKSKK